MASVITEFPNVTEAAILCLSDRHWWVFLSSSLLVFAAFFTVVLASHLVGWLVTRKTRRISDHVATEIGWLTEAKDWAGELISGQTKTGKILVSRPCVTKLLLLISPDDDESDHGFGNLYPVESKVNASHEIARSILPTATRQSIKRRNASMKP